MLKSGLQIITRSHKKDYFCRHNYFYRHTGVLGAICVVAATTSRSPASPLAESRRTGSLLEYASKVKHVKS
jgi:hypothetical protein